MVGPEILIDPFVVKPGSRVSLRKDYPSSYRGDFVRKQDATEVLKRGIETLAELQDKLYAQNRYAVLLVLQALDAAGKDSVIKHVMSGLNPQGTDVHPFRVPSSDELDHDYLWRTAKALPQRGRIGIFNRSYYEEVLVTRVNPEVLQRQQIPPFDDVDELLDRRCDEINNFEKYLDAQGIKIVKVFLNVSKEVQRQRFLERIDRPEKNWKLSVADVRERQHWDAYQTAYERAFSKTSTPWAKWHVVPADRKWFTRLAVSAVVIQALRDINPQYPQVGPEFQAQMREARRLLEMEAEHGR